METVWLDYSGGLGGWGDAQLGYKYGNIYQCVQNLSSGGNEISQAELECVRAGMGEGRGMPPGMGGFGGAHLGILWVILRGH